MSNRLKVYRYIKESIIARKFLPGEMIYERDIALELGVSRSPVREALQNLQDEGWLTVMPRRGSVVNPLSPVEIEEVLQIRTIIAAASLHIAAKRMGASDTAYLHSLIVRQEKAAAANDRHTFLEVDMEFHLTLVRLTGNRRLVGIAGNLLDSFRRIAAEVIQMEGFSASSVDDHKDIMEALAQGDVKKARNIMAVHIMGTQDMLL